MVLPLSPSDPKALLCDALGLYWCVREVAGLGRTLRLARVAELEAALDRQR